MKECPICHQCYNDEITRCGKDDNALKLILTGTTSIGNDRYLVEKRIGKGGMGIVFKARHKFLHTEHALKIIHPNLVEGDSSLLTRFRQEAILAASIHHPNVIRVTDFGVEHDTMPYLVMEFVDGIPLSNFLSPGKRLPPEKVFEILLPISLGVGEAHRKGIVHRDLKPQNIMVQSGLPLSRAVKVYDFGLAKIKSSESLGSFIQAKTLSILGSPPYMSPEQWENHPSDHQSDIYSIGVMLYQMLTGNLPFEGDSIPTMMYRHLMQPPPPFSSFDINLPAGIEEIVQQCLIKEKEKRPNNLEDVLTNFEEALNRAGIRTQSNYSDKRLTAERVEAHPEILTMESSKSAFSQTVPNDLTEPDTLSDSQKNRLKTYLRISPTDELLADKTLAQRFLQAQDRVEEAKEKVSEADKLVQDLAEAERIAEDAQKKALEAKERVELEVRRRVEAEMQERLAEQQKVWQEEEAKRLAEEAEARRKAEERANQLAQAALEAQRIAEQERHKAESEAHQRELEESVRREAEVAAQQLAKQISNAQFQYQEARKQAEREAQMRLEAENKLIEIENNLYHTAQKEAEIRKLAESEAQKQIREQAERYEKEALAAQERIEKARERVQMEAQKREEAEAARLHAEKEAERLAQEIKNVQQHIEAIKSRAFSDPDNQVFSSDPSLHYSREPNRNASSGSVYNPSDPTEMSFAPHNTNSNTPPTNLQTGGTGFSSTSNAALSSLFNSSGALNKKSYLPHIIGGTFVLLFMVVSIIGGFLFLKGSVFNSNTTPDNTNANAAIKENANEIMPTIMASPNDYIKNRMAQINGGSFQMGRSDVPQKDLDFGNQYPDHTVEVGTFYLDKTEVSNKQYEEFVNNAKHPVPSNWKDGKLPAGEENNPVAFVSLNDAQAYAQWAGKILKQPCRLPTEEEWEYAARNGNKQTTFPWGNDWQPDKANLSSGKVAKINETNDETLNGGIKNMLGNVAEWTSSKYMLYKGNQKKLDSIESELYVTRGGNYGMSQNLLANPSWLTTFRLPAPPQTKAPQLGFRILCQSK